MTSRCCMTVQQALHLPIPDITCSHNFLFSFFFPETHNLPKQPPLAQAVGQAAQCLAMMARTGSGSCAFASVDDYLH